MKGNATMNAALPESPHAPGVIRYVALDRIGEKVSL